MTTTPVTGPQPERLVDDSRTQPVVSVGQVMMNDDWPRPKLIVGGARLGSSMGMPLACGPPREMI